MEGFKPLLSGKVTDTAKLRYPMLASPKLDGIRAVVIDGVVLSRNLKPIPNKHVQALFGNARFNGLDGELICGDPTAKDCYHKTNSAVMSIDGTPDVRYFLFDAFKDHKALYEVRRKEIVTLYLPNTVLVQQVEVENEEQLLTLEEGWLAQGYEGVMVRSAYAHYKFGRSTDKEGILLKLKRFSDAEAAIVGFEELMSNQNEATKDALGHTERSSHQSGLVPMNTLGALIVKDYTTNVEFKVGTGFDADTRQKFWEGREELVGQIIKYKSFAVGVKDRPRFPVFLGFRDAIDL